MNAVGSYIDRDSVIHHLHPVTKNLLFIGTFVICLLTNHPAILAALFLCVVAVGAAAKLPIIQSLKLLKSVALLIVIFSLVIWPFTLKEGTVLVTVGGLDIYSVGVWYGIAMTFRFCTIVLMSIYWMMFTSISEITLGLVKLGLPYKMAFSFSMSLRFVPLIINDLHTIKDAQRSRALEMDKGNLLGKIRKNVAILIPLSSRALGLIKQISVSLEARGFESGTGKRTSISGRPFTGRDIGMIVTLACLFGILLYLRITAGGLITTTVL